MSLNLLVSLLSEIRVPLPGPDFIMILRYLFVGGSSDVCTMLQGTWNGGPEMPLLRLKVPSSCPTMTDPRSPWASIPRQQVVIWLLDCQPYLASRVRVRSLTSRKSQGGLFRAFPAVGDQVWDTNRCRGCQSHHWKKSPPQGARGLRTRVPRRKLRCRKSGGYGKGMNQERSVAERYQEHCKYL